MFLWLYAIFHGLAIFKSVIGLDRQHLLRRSSDMKGLSLMGLVANLANTKWCQKSEKWLKPWHIGTHLRVLSENYPLYIAYQHAGVFMVFKDLCVLISLTCTIGHKLTDFLQWSLIEWKFTDVLHCFHSLVTEWERRWTAAVWYLKLVINQFLLPSVRHLLNPHCNSVEYLSNFNSTWPDYTTDCLVGLTVNPTHLLAVTWPRPVQPVFWTGSFLRHCLFGQANVSMKNLFINSFWGNSYTNFSSHTIFFKTILLYLQFVFNNTNFNVHQFTTQSFSELGLDAICVGSRMGVVGGGGGGVCDCNWTCSCSASIYTTGL